MSIVDAQMIRVDAEFKSLIPPLTGDERAQLEANLLADGCCDPLKVWSTGDVLLDGHNRKEICERLGIDYRVEQIDLPDRDAALLWIKEHQLGRRNLTEDQRAAFAYDIQQRRSARAKRERAVNARAAVRERNPVNENSDLSDTLTDKSEPIGKTDTRAAVAKQAKVPERKLRHIAEVAKQAPELVERIERGETTIKAAVKQVRKQAKAEQLAAIPADLPTTTDRYRLIHADLAEVNGEVPPGTLDWIITDPPYPEKFLPVYDALSVFAARTLKPGGSLICMVGQSYLPQIMAMLAGHLTYHWTLAYLTPGGQAVQQWDRQVNTFWKPLLWFTNGTRKGDWIGDVCKSSPNDNDKRHHHWGQSESGMADIIERFTKPGESVCDPFCGGGTTGVVAVAMNRRFIGIDLDADAIATSKARLAGTP